jgi:hypothetical protein
LDKKAEIGLTTLVAIIIFVITALLITTYYLALGKVGQEAQEGLPCHLMLKVQDATDILPFGITTIENQCRTISKTIKPKNIYDAQVDVGNILANSAWILNHGNVASAWNEGFFKQDKCLILYTITFEPDKRLREITLNSKDFSRFLQTTHYKLIDDIPYTYETYITSHPSKGEVEVGIFIPENLDFSKSYAVAVSSGKEKNPVFVFAQNLAVTSSVGFVITRAFPPATGVVVVWTAVQTLWNTETKNKNVMLLYVMPFDSAIRAGCYTL